jgi:DNA polymerase elongation subunit (family B)
MRLSQLLASVTELSEGLLISATYDGDKRVAVLKFYDPSSHRIWLWYDTSRHKPYCYTKLPSDQLDEIKARKDVIVIETEEKLDLIADKMIKARKIIATDPLAIGGSSNKSIRDQIKAWEADIKYYENYVYDKGLKIGTYYSIQKGELIPVTKDVPELVMRSLNEILMESDAESSGFIREWAELLGQPLCEFKRIAMDIEVANEENRVPDPEKADRDIIAVSFFNEAESLVYLYSKKNDDSSLENGSASYKHFLFTDEASMIRTVFSKMLDYPIVITFNGDDFDLRYLKHRAEKLGIKEGEIPIQLQRQEASLKHGVHIDLYRFFNNRSIQVYVYGNRYSEHTLNGIAEALLNKSKFEFEGDIAKLSLLELANYCLNDSQLTYELTSANSSLLMKILLAISRIAKMPMNDVARLGVSNWIRSMLFYEHRKIHALIPRTDELADKGGASSEAIIRGKKYKGGLVIEPKPGVHFGVSVLDFASLVYDESIFLRKRQTGQVYKTKIGEFVEQRLPSGVGFAAKEIGPTWDVLSFDYERQQASWKTVTAVIRHPSRADVLEVVTESGRRVCITKGHSVISLDSDGKKKTVRGSDLKIGDYLVVLSSFCAEQRETSLDLLPHLPQLVDYDITRGGRGHGKTIVLKARRSHRKFVLPRYLSLTSDLMWGLGYWLAEGWVYRNKYVESLRIEASSSDIDLVQSKFNMAGFRTWKSESKTTGCSNLGIGARHDGGPDVLSSTIFAKLVKRWFGNHASEKRIPDWVLQLPVQMRRAFIDGYCKGDEFNSNSHQEFVSNGKYKVGSYSRLLINNLMSMGLMSGLHCFSKALSDSESYLTWSSDGAQTYHKTKRPPPELMVRSEHVRSFAKTPYYDSHRQEPVRYDRVNKTSVQTYEEPFRRFYSGNCHFEKVKQIIAVKTRLPVYDISVRRSESFFNGDGILVSNSLYPSIIKVYNLSYETVNCSHEECRTNAVPDTTHWICKKRKGITSLVIGSLRDLRVKHYKQLTKDPKLSKDDRELYNVVSQGLKVILNAGYGVMGFETFALYCLPVAEATAALGRYAITKTIDKCNQLAINVIYSDTDSLFLQNPGKEQIDTVTKWADEELGVELDLDKVYRYVAFSERKKNYFGVLQDGTADIKGLTGKKSVDGKTPILARVDGSVTYTKVEDVHRIFQEGKRIELLTITDELSTVWSGISDASVHKVEDVYEIRTSKGRILKLSGDHSIYLMENFGNLHCKETRAIKKGDVIVGSQFIPESSSEMKLNVSSILSGRVIEKDGLLYSNRPHAITEIPIRKTLPITRELAMLLGIFTAEGNIADPVGPRNSEISQSLAENPKVCRELERIWLIIFGWEIKINARRKNNDLRYYVPILYAEFFKYLCGGDSSAKHVPSFVFNVKKEIIAAYLRGLFSGNGYSSAKRISISSMSESLMNQTAYLLSFFDIDVRMRRTYLPQYKEYSYWLSVIGSSSRRRFVEKIGFLQERYQKKPGTNPRNKELIPLTTIGLVSIKKVIATRFGLSRFRHINMHDISHFNLMRLHRYNSVIDDLGRHASPSERTVLARISRMINSRDVTYDEVVSIRKIRGQVEMYDFSVPQYERFVAGNLPTLLHNSQTPEFLKKTFYNALEILDKVYDPSDFERARSNIKELLRSTIAKLRNKEIPVEELAFNVMIGKSISGFSNTTPQHVKAAKLLQDKGKEIKAGDIISYVKTKTPPFVKPASLAKLDEIDADKYLEYASSMFDQMLDALGFSFDEIMGSTTLDLFWS